MCRTSAAPQDSVSKYPEPEDTIRYFDAKGP
jgi:hypothetical protein